jgi:hypothetical protein
MELPNHVRSLKEENSSAFQAALAIPEVNLAFYERTKDPIEELLIKDIDKLAPDYQFWSVRQSKLHIIDPLKKSFSKIGSLPPTTQSAILDDTIHLINMFIDVTGEQQPFVSLRSITEKYFSNNETSVSNRWHRDSTVISLFKTFVGAGTEWTPNDNVVRSAWAGVSIQQIHEPEAKYVNDPSLYYSSSCNTIGFLKGEISPQNIDARSLEFIENFISKDEIIEFNTGNSLIHRGPGAQSTEKRLVLTLSSFSKPLFGIR